MILSLFGQGQPLPEKAYWNLPLESATELQSKGSEYKNANTIKITQCGIDSHTQVVSLRLIFSTVILALHSVLWIGLKKGLRSWPKRAQNLDFTHFNPASSKAERVKILDCNWKWKLCAQQFRWLDKKSFCLRIMWLSNFSTLRLIVTD